MKTQDLFSVAGKVAVVTGGSRGIGRMIAEGFVENDVRVYISSRKAEVCDQAAAELGAHGECVSVPADLSSMDGIEQLAAALAEREERVHVLVNNAGAVWSEPIEQFSEKGWDKVVDLNLKSPFFLTQKLLPQLRAAATADDPARVIHVASIDGLHVNPIDTFSYAASKSGLIHLTRAMARRLSEDDITVNAIAPGPFESKMMEWTLEHHGEHIRASNPRKRIGTPEDMAGVAIYLSSRAGAYVNGAVIPVDGGIVAVS
ncbi:MAG TPA: SDR family oxidoreductase [Thermoanaerobaculia bacterium]|nr:SDR family oxidoreductase [Thermoanaerobaculia bacterium]